MTLTEFLLARIAEDEALAQVATPGQWERNSGWSITAPPPEGWYGPNVVVETKRRNDAEFIASHSPARVLVECEAKREAIDAAWADQCRIDGEWGSCQSQDEMSAKNDNPPVVEYLATVYADHPDYLPEWKP